MHAHRSSPRSLGRALVALTVSLVAVAALIARTRPEADRSTAPAPPPALAMPAPVAKPKAAPSVVLITLDTTRADALGCYGAKGDPTPNLDRLAARGVRFEHAQAPTPLTLPSHASMLSGRYPPELGVRDNSPTPVPASIPLVQEAYRTAGHFTAAFVSAEPVRAHWGLKRGFDLYNDATARVSRLSPPERRGDRTVEIALQWLRVWLKTDKPFFLWVHLFDPHHPYTAPEPFASRFKDPYTAEVAFADHCVGRLLRELDAAGRADRTAIVVAADHGEGRGEHGEATHGHLIQQSTMRVPLIFSWPEHWRSGATAPEPVSLADVAPTLYHLLDVAAPATSGRTLLATLRGERAPAPRPIYGESLYDFVHFGWAPLYSIRDGNRVLIDADGETRLFDLARDPGERRDLAETEPDVARRLARELARIRSGFATAKTDAGSLTAPPGYLQGSAAGPALARDRSRRGKRPIPMTRMPAVDAFEAAKDASFRTTDRDDALSAIDRLLADDPDNPSFHYWRGRVLRDLGNADAERGKAGHADALNHFTAAMDAFRATLRRRPDHRGAQDLLLQTTLLAGAPEATLRLGRAMLDEGHDTPMVRVFMAQARLLPGPQRDPDEAAALLRATIARHGPAEVHAELRRAIARERARDLRRDRPTPPSERKPKKK